MRGVVMMVMGVWGFPILFSANKKPTLLPPPQRSQASVGNKGRPQHLGKPGWVWR